MSHKPNYKLNRLKLLLLYPLKAEKALAAFMKIKREGIGKRNKDALPSA